MADCTRMGLTGPLGLLKPIMTALYLLLKPCHYCVSDTAQPDHPVTDPRKFYIAILVLVLTP